jgi:hypothetical protein
MNSHDFLRIVREAFEPFLMELGFSMDKPSISGRFYCVDFSSDSHQVSVSYEPGDNEFFIFVGESRNSKFIDIDDRAKTPRLTDLNNRYMAAVTQLERLTNEKAFESVMVNVKEERLILKAAKELRLVLPKYLRSLDGLPT